MQPTPRGPVDWRAAARLAGRLAAPGPVADRATLVELVADLRTAATAAAGHVVEATGLTPADGRDPAAISRVVVVDRPRWAAANAEMFAVMAAPLATRRDGTPVEVPDAARLAAAAQVGGVLALLSGKVIGQYDPFTSAPGEPGRLLLVAPNVLATQRQLKVDGRDFRLWVALHEQTHALQFAAAPWLADHLRARSAELMGDLADLAPGGGHDERSALPRLDDVLGALVRAVTDGDGGVLSLLTPRQRKVFDEVGAVMSLLEGHADVMMDEVGPAVVPSVRAIRRAFERRRDESAKATGLDRLVRRLLGMDLKLAQYRDGAAFVRAVRERVGLDGLNAVWSGPQTLPSAAEISDPAAWVRRVHG
ncbi:zinc-dependent metalloprotease [Cellulomonas sp. S1-8]|uniref:zinc-dependent metalloprotease n=1 Tax=Cellulomonas sp. S1-8 TaxID=2904790 RepID=UPI002244707D|nr:zinc-dependent metalloprotease [Cellulomonas sp. S1-8]UZN04009.1 zinc-dependent metalloprotease [Cellulomonas sp. S1-8]